MFKSRKNANKIENKEESCTLHSKYPLSQWVYCKQEQRDIDGHRTKITVFYGFIKEIHFHYNEVHKKVEVSYVILNAVAENRIVSCIAREENVFKSRQELLNSFYPEELCELLNCKEATKAKEADVPTSSCMYWL